MVIDTFNKTYESRNCTKSLMFHSDQESEYTAKEFKQILDNNGICQSFSKPGHPYNNAVIECFFKYIKKEELDRYTYSSIQDVELACFKYIEGYYNSKRFHSHNNNETPNQAEKDYYNKKH